MKKMGMLFAAMLVCGAGSALAQAPAGAPAGANGICKDGTYSMSANKAGACRGHQGVQTWYAAPTAKPSASTAKTAGAATSTTTSAAPAPTPAATKPAAMPAPTPAPAAPSRPAPTPATAAAPAAPAAGKRLSPAQAAAQKTAAPGGGPGLVWVNTASNVYHCSDDVFYGKTKAGAYMSEADAKAKGAHGDRGKTCTGK